MFKLQIPAIVMTVILSVNCLSAEIINLADFEKKIFSQNGEDGIIKKIFDLIGTTDNYFVEFGVQNGNECSTRLLHEQEGWRGLCMDGGYEDPTINLHQEFITVENVIDLFKKYKVPVEFDLLSIDIDFNDFHVWYELSKVFRPRVVTIEYNATHQPTEDKICIYDPFGCWDRTNYFGASLLGLYQLGRLRGYSLVYADKKGINCFFVRDDILEQKSWIFKDINDVQKIYQKPKYGRGPNGGHKKDPLNRQYTSAKILLAENVTRTDY